MREHLRCPSCGVEMQAFNYAGDSGVILDRCTACEGAGSTPANWKRWCVPPPPRGRGSPTTPSVQRDLHREEVRQDALEQHDIRSTPFPDATAVASPFISGNEGS